MELTIIVKNTFSIRKFKKRFMNIRQKMVLIVISGILLSATLGTTLIYKFVQREVLASEAMTLEKITSKFTAVASRRFSEPEIKLKSLAKLLESELNKPIKKDEIKAFHQLMEKNADGVWRNKKEKFDGKQESGIFLPPNAKESDLQKIQHLRIKKTMDVFGASASRYLENVWYLSPHRSEVIFDKIFDNFVFDLPADNDYTQTPWVTYTNPELNPSHLFRFTPPIFDPISKIWMIGAIYPLYANNQWIGSLGEDIQLTAVLESMFQSEQMYAHTEHFLIDQQGNFILAGAWQKEIEISSESLKPHFENESDLQELFKRTLTNKPLLLTNNLTLHHKRYVAIGMILEPLGWRYYLCVPVSEIMASTHELFLNLLEMILFIGILNGFLVFTMTGKTITNRIEKLTDSINGYTENQSLRIANQLSGNDEISNAVFAFDKMANDIEMQQIKIKESHDQFEALVMNIPGVTYRCALDVNWTMLFISDSIEELSGYPASDFIENAVRDYNSIIYVDDLNYVNAEFDDVALKRPFILEYRIVHRSGEIRWVHEHGRAVFNENDKAKFLDGFILDITERKKAEQEIERLAFYDSLTDLPNRRLLQDRLKIALAMSKYHQKYSALLFIDLDNFKNLNDTLGHDIGDLLLQKVAQRLKLCVRDCDTVARLGGDEFVMMIEDLSSKEIKAAEQAETLGEMILSSLNQNYKLDIHDYKITPSIGITLFNGLEASIDELLKQADIAMYQSKAAGKNALSFYNPQMQQKINARVELEKDLNRAINEYEFILYYQAQVHHEEIVGAEVLIRWNHPKKGLIAPDAFIPLAEETGLIIPIGQWVLETACAQIKEWESHSNMKHLQLAVNVSSKQFQQPSFVAQIRALLENSGIIPNRLKIELTESLLLDNVESTIAKMIALRELGVCFSMDDFGTGYSSLSYLTKLPLNQLKIDQAFIRNMGQKTSDAIIVQTIIGMTRNLDIDVIAEGVETAVQRDFLKLHDCNVYQGYFFSKPVPLNDFEQLLNHDV
jgi:diguanylate cyclase (GGDEF)-like protein/PAS domain S-box-containing protein